MRHPFLHGITSAPAAESAAEVSTRSVAEPAAGRRSFFVRVGAAAAGLLALLSGRRSEAQVPTTQALGEEGGGVQPSTRALGEEGGTSPSATTYAIGEEGGGGGNVTTYAVGEEGSTTPPPPTGGNVTTYAIGEEGSGNVTTFALGEEGASRPVTTQGLYEEGSSWQYRRFRTPRSTTFAAGEEGGGRYYYRIR